MSNHAQMAPKNDIVANVRIPPNPVAQPSFVPAQGSSRSVPIRAPSAIARMNPIKTVGSIRRKKKNICFSISNIDLLCKKINSYKKYTFPKKEKELRLEPLIDYFVFA